ncbi:hypothetical protein GFL80_27565 [Rhizobium leguminosarum bv. viciae]|nr:hypothetical protein [Rhizobium leguminosarum bv. viciae]
MRPAPAAHIRRSARPASDRPSPWRRHGRTLQRRASFQTRKGRCSTLNGCIILSLNRVRLKELCSSISMSRCSR